MNFHSQHHLIKTIIETVFSQLATTTTNQMLLNFQANHGVDSENSEKDEKPSLFSFPLTFACLEGKNRMLPISALVKKLTSNPILIHVRIKLLALPKEQLLKCFIIYNTQNFWYWCSNIGQRFDNRFFYWKQWSIKFLVGPLDLDSNFLFNASGVLT